LVEVLNNTVSKVVEQKATGSADKSRTAASGLIQSLRVAIGLDWFKLNAGPKL
jgi:hypothetical protein